MGFQAEATDEMLMVRYQRGDRDAFANLVNRHLATVFSYALQLLGDENAATAVTEATFSSVVGRAAEFKHESRFTTWLFGFAHAHSAHQSRAPLPQPEMSVGVREDTALGEVVDRVPPGPQRSAVRALSMLSAEHREALLLREVAHLPFGEIAVVTGADEETVVARLAQALDRVQHEVGNSEEYARALR